MSESASMMFLRHAWKYEGHGMGKSWARLNGTMQAALKLAIESGMEFGIDDFAVFAKDFRSCYWIGSDSGERYYRLACAGPHGPNPSAYQAYERWRKRKPFIVLEKPNEAKKIRLHVGAKFRWHDNKVTGVGRWHDVEVISFAEDQKSVVACSYLLDYGDTDDDGDKMRKPGAYPTRRVKKLFIITHDEIAYYHKVIREYRKDAAEAKEIASTGTSGRC